MCLVEFGCLSICYLKDVTDVYSLLKNYQNPNAIRLTVTRSLEFLWNFSNFILAFMVMLLVVKSNEDFLQEVKLQIFIFFLDGKVYKISDINDKIGKTSNKKLDM